MAGAFKFQFGIASLLGVTTLVAIPLSAARTFGSWLAFLTVAWVVMVLVLVPVSLRIGDTPKKRWSLAFLLSLAMVYGPLLIAAINTWLFDGGNCWVRAEFWKYTPLVPGGVIIEVTSLAIWHHRPELSPAAGLSLAGLLSAAVVAIAAWSAVKTRWARWILLPCLAAGAVWSALALDAAMRA